MTTQKRVRYNGPGDIAIFDSEESVYDPPIVAHLEPGQLLPLETDQGKAMPAHIRDEFLHKDNDRWTEVSHSEAKADDKKGHA